MAKANRSRTRIRCRATVRVPDAGHGGGLRRRDSRLAGGGDAVGRGYRAHVQPRRACNRRPDDDANVGAAGVGRLSLRQRLAILIAGRRCWVDPIPAAATATADRAADHLRGGRPAVGLPGWVQRRACRRVRGRAFRSRNCAA